MNIKEVCVLRAMQRRSELMFDKVVLDLIDCIKKRKYFKIAKYFVLLVFLIGAFVFLINFVMVNIDAFMWIGIVLFAIYSLLYERGKKQKGVEAEVRRKEIERRLLLEQEEINQNYLVIQKALFFTLKELYEVLKIKEPQFLSEIVPPTKTFQNGTVTIYQFTVLKNDAISLLAFKDILQQRITQKLMEGEYREFTQAFYVFEGTTFPLIYVTDIEEAGVNIYISLVITNEEFCRHDVLRRLSKQNVSRNNNDKNIYDKDF